MKYKTKLYLTFCILILGSVLLVASFSFYESKSRFFQLLKSKVLAISSTGATLLDIEEIKALIKSLDPKSPAFNSVVTQLKKIRDVNRNQDTYISDVYLITQNPKNPHELIFLADAEKESNPEYAAPGLLYPEGIKIGILSHLRASYTPPGTFQNDRWGNFFPAYVPIFDTDGSYIATIGVDLLAKSVVHDLTNLYWIALNGIGIALAAGLIATTVLSGQITHSLNRICQGVAKIGSGELKTRIQIITEDEFAELAKEINQMALGLQERERLKINFIRYVSKHIMEMIVKEGKLPDLEGEKRKITVLFCDIRHFTHFAETYPPEKVVRQLNEFLSAMIDVIFEKDGTLDKFIGDGLMIEFGAPLEDPNQEKHAVETAISMQKTLMKLNRHFEIKGLPKLEMVIGIHTGPAITGNIGSDKRMEYTAIGDTVNIASRIEDAAKNLNASILISETTYQAIRDLFETKDLGPISLKGKKDQVRVYSVKIPLPLPQ